VIDVVVVVRSFLPSAIVVVVVVEVISFLVAARRGRDRVVDVKYCLDVRQVPAEVYLK